jgi:pimeloyl-ACP methyl ester carboxylesterase
MAEKSTNVRSGSRPRPARGRPAHWRGLAVAGWRAVFRTVGPLAPAAAGRLAQRLFFSPPRFHGPLAAPAGAQQMLIEVEGTKVAAWRCGSGPAVLLMHGWGGASAQIAALAPALLARGFSVVALDAPGHGRTAGRQASLIHFTRALQAVVRATGPVEAVVGHSLGAAAAALAVAEGLEVESVVLIASAADPARWTRTFAATFGVPRAAMEEMGQRSERHLHFQWSSLHLRRLLSGFPGRVLFVHDRDDREVRWNEAWQLSQELTHAQFVLTAGLGHRRILSHPAVADVVAGFLDTGLVQPTRELPLARLCSASYCGRPTEDGHAYCMRCALDHDLFVRGEARWPVGAI